jgi:Kef-type K+ transport system membrane component KefB
MNWRGSVAVGFGMTPRSEVAMIVALIGLGRDIIQQPVYTTVFTTSVITTIIPLVVIKNWVYAKSIRGSAERVKG